MNNTPSYKKVSRYLMALQEALAPFVHRKLAVRLGGQLRLRS
jgi:hypothetical protein